MLEVDEGREAYTLTNTSLLVVWLGGSSSNYCRLVQHYHTTGSSCRSPRTIRRSELGGIPTSRDQRASRIARITCTEKGGFPQLTPLQLETRFWGQKYLDLV